MTPTPRTAFRLDPELLRRVDERAKAEDVSRSDFVVAAIEAALGAGRKVATTRPARGVVLRGGKRPPNAPAPPTSTTTPPLPPKSSGNMKHVQVTILGGGKSLERRFVTPRPKKAK